MTTSIIDYIFRELAVTYMGRHDLAHVKPDDTRGDALHEHDDEPEFESEEEVAVRTVEPKPAPKPHAPRSGHLHPGGNGHANGNGHGLNGHGAKANGTAALADKIRTARQKGYEGDPCPECGQLTMVRSGACCKCDACGASSGCS